MTHPDLSIASLAPVRTLTKRLSTLRVGTLFMTVTDSRRARMYCLDSVDEHGRVFASSFKRRGSTKAGLYLDPESPVTVLRGTDEVVPLML